jgi:hypothetical protein
MIYSDNHGGKEYLERFIEYEADRIVYMRHTFHPDGSYIEEFWYSYETKGDTNYIKRIDLDSTLCIWSGLASADHFFSRLEISRLGDTMNVVRWEEVDNHTMERYSSSKHSFSEYTYRYNDEGVLLEVEDWNGRVDFYHDYGLPLPGGLGPVVETRKPQHTFIYRHDGDVPWAYSNGDLVQKVGNHLYFYEEIP